MPYRNITSPIYYVNGEPHIGHAYTTLACDIAARFWRMMGDKTLLCTGTDEHGQKVHKAAEKAGIDAQKHCDILSQKFRDLLIPLNISSEDLIFIRTTEERHKIAAKVLWDKLFESGHIYLGEYVGFYAERDEAYYAESDLIDGLAPTGAPVELLKEECYFLRLSAFQERLVDFLESHKEFILPESRFNEVLSFVKRGLHDLAISRSHVKWGIPVPQNDSHVMYVWIDALCNYITCLRYPSDMKSVVEVMPRTDHIVGKDILIFHAVYWPIMLMAADLPLPNKIVAHGWWKNGDDKMSKSLGNVIDIRVLIDKYGIDAVRFFLFREIPFGQDGNFSTEAIERRINGDLVNNLGNLVQRVFSFAAHQFNGSINVPGDYSDYSDAEKEFLNWGDSVAAEILTDHMKNYRFHLYLECIMTASREANQFIDAMKPWELCKSIGTDKQKDLDLANKVIYLLIQRIMQIARFISPFIPETSEKIFAQIDDSANQIKQIKISLGGHLFQKID